LFGVREMITNWAIKLPKALVVDEVNESPTDLASPRGAMPLLNIRHPPPLSDFSFENQIGRGVSSQPQQRSE